MINFNPLVEGRFTLRVLDAETGKVKRKYRFRNLITNSGLDRLGAATSLGSSTTYVVDQVMLSTSTTAPTVSDTTMGGTVVSTSTSSPIFSTGWIAGVSPDYISSYQVGKRFAVGAATGTWSSIGVGWSGGVFAKSLIKDSGGTPTSITILSTEILDVRYELRVVPDLSTKGPFSITINGTAYNYTLKPFLVSSTTIYMLSAAVGYTSSGSGSPGATIVGAAVGATVSHESITGGGVGPLRACTGHSGTPIGVSANSMSAYVGGTYYRDFTFSWSTTDVVDNNKIVCLAFSMGATVGNFGMLINGGVQANGIPKTNLETFSITVRISWGRAP